jgi:Transposase DDE domain
MSPDTLILGCWSEVLDWLRRLVDVDGSARTHKAFQRAREVRSAGDLLRLAMVWSVCGLSLRSTCAWAAVSGVAALSDPSLLERLSRAADWLGFLVKSALEARVGSPPTVAGRRLRIVDATSLCRPGADRTTWRLHVSYDLAGGVVDALALSDVHGGESLTRSAPRAGDLLVADAGYPKPGDLRSLVRAGADIVVRLGWNSLSLRTPEGEAFDLFAILRRFDGPWTERAIVVDDHQPEMTPLSARLIIVRKPEAEAETARRRVRQKAAKRGKTPDARSLEAAGFLLLLTTLPADAVPAGDVPTLYRFRWQVELVFKRWKSLLDLDALPAHSAPLARCWIYAKILAVLMIEDWSNPALAFSPSRSGAGPLKAVGLAPDCSVRRDHPTDHPRHHPHLGLVP